MPRKLLPFLLSIAVLAPATVIAQVPYAVSHGTETYTPITGGTVHPPVPYSAFPAFDEGVATIPIPFTFSWYAVDYTTVYAFTNGFVGFTAPAGMGILGPPRVVPSPANPVHNYIGAIWQDLNGGTNPAIRSAVTGVAPNRVLTIQFEGFERNRTPVGTTAVNFQVRLFETSNTVEVVMGPNFGIVSSTAGIENADGTQGDNLMEASPTCTGNCPCTPGNCTSLNYGTGGRRIRIELPIQPEIQGTVRAPPGAYPGSSFTANVDVLNAGLTPAGAFNYELFLSSSNTSISGAVSLGSFSLPSLGAVSTVNASPTLTVPGNTAVGDFYVAVSVDTTDAITEVDETNNVSFSALFRTGPDLTGSVDAPTETGPGETFDVQLELRSEGAPVAAAVQVMFYLSPTPTLTMASIPVGPELVTLPDGFSTSQTLTLTAPLALPPSPPSYYVVAVIDDGNAIVETDESNNELVSATTVDVRGADIEVPSFEGGDFGFRGQPYPMSTVITNTGAATARDFTICIILSDNLLISVVSDTTLLQTGLLSLAPGETQTIRLQPVIPAQTSTGTWYIAAIADCGTVVPEPVETDNTRRRTDPITVIDPSPDFTPLQIATASSAAAGETLPVAARIGNIGNAVGSGHLRLAISTNPGVTAADTVIYDTPAPLTIAPADEATVSTWAALPSDLPTGNYYIGALVDPDGLVPEILEDNNSLSVGPLVVVGTDLAIVSPRPPNPVIGNGYAWRFAAAGGAASYTWSATWEGDAPTGLRFEPGAAELVGTPTDDDAGSHPIRVRVTSGNLSAEQRYNLIISQPTLPLTVVTSRLPPAVAGEPYSVALVAAGGAPPYQWALGSPGPAGISVAPDGTLGGEPQLVGPATFTVVVRDELGQRASGRLSIDVVDPSASITITTADVPTGVVNEAYQTAFNASGGMQPYTWIIEGSVPGLEFNPTNAQLTGTPTIAGDYELVIEVRDVTGLLDRNAYSVEIVEEGVLRILTGGDDSSRLPDGQVAKEYLDEGEPAQLRADPSEGTTWMLANGELPPGLSLQSSTGIISGTPSEGGAYAFTVVVKNRANDFRRKSLVIFIAEAEGTTPPIDSGGCTCVGAGVPRGAAYGWLLGVGLLWVLRRRRA